ncbi:MAG TPA: endolytic transglycosylase MltG [Pseudolysinimonas sp.]|nr:endolytic transglycosylase MltG [Pseudolysinimonas sp.]
MANEPSWDEIFRSPGQPTGADRSPSSAEPSTGLPGVRADDPFAIAAAEARTQQPSAAKEASETLTRRQLREQEENSARRGGSGTKPPTKRRRARIALVIILVSILALGGAAAATAWILFEDRVREVMGWEVPNDYVGEGNGTEVEVTIIGGQIGSDVATTLYEAGVTKTYEAFYELLLGLETQPNFIPGTYALQEEMSAQAALDALLDESNRKVNSAVIREGLTLSSYVELLSAGTGIAAEEFEAAIADYTSYGLPENAVSLEGYLFPATYEFDPGVTARDIIQLLVNRTFQSLDAAGVAPENRNEVLTIASIIQREARIADDFYKVSRVIQNRLAIPMRLEMDSTAQYGENAQDSAFSTAEQLAAVNGYNTYTHDGLPIGPIAGVGDLAIEAALHPADGPWIFFVTVNLDTGETLFSETAAEHERGVAQLRAWCRETSHPAC